MGGADCRSREHYFERADLVTMIRRPLTGQRAIDLPGSQASGHRLASNQQHHCAIARGRFRAARPRRAIDDGEPRLRRSRQSSRVRARREIDAPAAGRDVGAGASEIRGRHAFSDSLGQIDHDGHESVLFWFGRPGASRRGPSDPAQHLISDGSRDAAVVQSPAGDGRNSWLAVDENCPPATPRARHKPVRALDRNCRLSKYATGGWLNDRERPSGVRCRHGTLVALRRVARKADADAGRAPGVERQVDPTCRPHEVRRRSAGLCAADSPRHAEARTERGARPISRAPHGRNHEALANECHWHREAGRAEVRPRGASVPTSVRPARRIGGTPCRRARCGRTLLGATADERIDVHGGPR